jgi:hypothetical protein
VKLTGHNGDVLRRQADGSWRFVIETLVELTEYLSVRPVSVQPWHGYLPRGFDLPMLRHEAGDLALLPLRFRPAWRLPTCRVHRAHVLQDLGLRHSEGRESTRDHRAGSPSSAGTVNDHPSAGSQFLNNGLNDIAKHVRLASRVIRTGSANQIFELECA